MFSFLGENHNVFIDEDRIDEILNKMLRTFEKVFPVSYKYAILDTILERRVIGPPNTYILDSAPMSSGALKAGMLIKRGAHMKTWKRRYFCAYNEADNFVVKYSKYSSSHNELGRISCCGYEVVPFSPKEAETFDLEFGFKLVPFDNTKRTWWLAADDLEDRAVWMLILSNACRKTNPETKDPDPTIREAFKSAYQIVKQLYGFYGSTAMYRTTGDEVAMIEALLWQVIRRELLDEAIPSIMNDDQEYLEGMRDLAERKKARGRKQSYEEARESIIVDDDLELNTSGSKRTDSSKNNSTASSSSLSSPSGLFNALATGFSRSNTIENQGSDGKMNRTRTIVDSNGMNSAGKNETPLVKRAQRVQIVKELVKTKIKKLAPAKWNDIRSAGMKKFVDFVRSSVVPYMEEIPLVEERIESLLFDPVTDVIHAAHEDMMFRLINPMSKACAYHIVDAYEMAIRSLFESMSSVIINILRNPSTLQDEIAKLLHQVEYNTTVGSIDPEDLNSSNVGDDGHSSILLSSKEILYTMYTVHLADISEHFVGSITALEIYGRVLDDLSQLLQNAIHTFGHGCKTQGVTSRIIYIFNETILKLCTDMNTKIRESFYAILIDLSQSCVQDTMVQPCHDIFKQTRKTANIPKHLKEVIHVHFIGEKFIKEIIHGSLVEEVNTVFQNTPDRFVEVVTQLCDTLPMSCTA